MKEGWQILVLSCSIILASLITSMGLIQAAKIIGKASKVRSDDALIKIVQELTKALNEKDSGRMGNVAKDQKVAEIAGSKKIEGVTIGTNPTKGVASAPVLMVEFSDLQCPFTKRFYQQVFPQIDKEYIATGKIKFTYRDYLLGFHQFAKPAAILARCAGKQGKYWSMFDKLLTGESLNNELFKKYTQELGLNLNQLEKCQVSSEINTGLDKDAQDAAQFSVDGTPTFFINGRFISGAQPFAVFKKIIDEELAKTVNKQ